MRALAYILIATLLIANALALGVAPASIDMTYGNERTETVFIVNNEHKDMAVLVYASGELSQYIQLSQAIVKLSASEETKAVTVTIRDPKISTPGSHTADLTIIEIPPDQAGEGTVIATRKAVIAKISMLVPYPGKYAEGDLVVPKAAANMPIDFVVKLRNKGTQTIEKATARVEIYSPTNELLSTLQSDAKPVEPDQMRELVAKYQNGLPKGRYYAKAIVSYDGQELILEQSFQIGELVVDIRNIYAKEFKLGQIALFDIIVESLWNEPIPDVYADMEIKDGYGATLTSFKTAQTDLAPYEKEVLNAYWDTKGISAGQYQAKVTLHFLGNNIEKSITLNVREDGIDVDLMPTAKVVQEPTSKRDMYIVLLVIISIIVNIALFVIFARRKKE
jgi:hypothetical protein